MASLSSHPRPSRAYPIRRHPRASQAASAVRKLPGRITMVFGFVAAIARPAFHGPSTPQGSMLTMSSTAGCPQSSGFMPLRTAAVM